MNHHIYNVETVEGLTWHLYPTATEGQDAAQCQNAPYRVIFKVQDEQGELYELLLGDDLNDVQDLGLYSALHFAMQAATKHQADNTRTTGLLTWRPQYDDPFDTISRGGLYSIESAGKMFRLCKGVMVLALYGTLEAAQDAGEGVAKDMAKLDAITPHAGAMLEALEAARDYLKTRTHICDEEGQSVLAHIQSALELTYTSA